MVLFILPVSYMFALPNNFGLFRFIKFVKLSLVKRIVICVRERLVVQKPNRKYVAHVIN